MTSIHKTDFERFAPVPQEARQVIDRLLGSGELFRYSGHPDQSPTSQFEREFATYLGMKYAVAVNSCSSAIFLALRLCGVEPGDRVFVPAFTFTAVPSAVVLAGAEPILVEIDSDFRMDVEDFRRKALLASVLLLSHMRGYVSNLDEIEKICAECGIVIIEDAAHALGSTWRGRQVGSFGRIGCFSLQSNKIINAGEGGVLTTDDEEIAVKAIIMSGAYEGLYRFHGVESALFDRYKTTLPLHNMRLTNVQAAIALPQLRTVGERAAAYRRLHRKLVDKLKAASNLLAFPQDDDREVRVPDSLQFRIPTFDSTQMKTFIHHVQDKLPLSALGLGSNARAFRNWEYLPDRIRANMQVTRQLIATTCDMRLPIDLSDAHLDYAVEVISGAARIAETA